MALVAGLLVFANGTDLRGGLLSNGVSKCCFVAPSGALPGSCGVLSRISGPGRCMVRSLPVGLPLKRLSSAIGRSGQGIGRGVVMVAGGKEAGSSGNEKTMLFVGQLPWILDSWGLEKLFEPYGKVGTFLHL